VVLTNGFKDYRALLFMKGVIMNNPKKLLVLQTENMQTVRQIRFINLNEIIKQKTLINSYIKIPL